MKILKLVKKIILEIIILVVSLMLLACNSDVLSNEKTKSKASQENIKNENKDFKVYEDNIRKIRFKYPSNWCIEEMKEQNTILIMCQDIEEKWQSNIFIELWGDDENREVSKQIDDLVLGLSKFKKQFKLEEKGISKTKSGINTGYIIYNCFQDNLELKEKEYLYQLGDNKVLLVTASVVNSLWDKYKSDIEIVFGSIEKM